MFNIYLRLCTIRLEPFSMTQHAVSSMIMRIKHSFSQVDIT